MGYYIYQDGAVFTIEARQIDNVINAIHALSNNPSDYSWVKKHYPTTRDIRDIFQCWRWTVDLHPNSGDVVDITFDGEKLGDDYTFFCAIAPFVKAGSFIQMRGEEGEQWRWFFDGHKCLESEPTIIWAETNNTQAVENTSTCGNKPANKLVVVNRCYGGFSLSNYAKLWLKTEGYQGNADSIPRHHPLLVRCVRELGSEANGKNAALAIMEVANKYYLDYNDGFEKLVTPESLAEEIDNTPWTVAE